MAPPTADRGSPETVVCQVQAARAAEPHVDAGQVGPPFPGPGGRGLDLAVSAVTFPPPVPPMTGAATGRCAQGARSDRGQAVPSAGWSPGRH